MVLRFGVELPSRLLRLNRRGAESTPGMSLMTFRNAPGCSRRWLSSIQTPPTQHPPPASPKKDRVWTLPNVLTMTRLAASPAIGYLIVQGRPGTALGLMIYASITDFLDGWIARRFNNRSALGSILDPAADKALMIVLASCLTISGDVPWWCGTTILGRDALLLASAVVIRWRSLPPPKTMTRYWDLSLPSVQVTPTTISKWNTFFQMIYLGTVLTSSAVPGFVPPLALEIAGGVVTATTLLSGISYLTSQTAVKYIRR